MSFDTLLRVLWRRWWLIGVVIALSIGGAFAYSARQHNRYQSTTSVYVRPALVGKDDKVSDIMSQLSYGSAMETFTSIVAARSSLAQATAELGFDPGVATSYSVIATHDPNSTVVQISVIGDDRESPEQVAHQLVHDLAATVHSRFAIYAVSGLNAPTAAVKVRPLTGRNVAFAAAGGAILGFVLAAASLWIRRRRRARNRRAPARTPGPTTA